MHVVGVEDQVPGRVDEVDVGDGVVDALLECLVDVLDLLRYAFLLETEYSVDGRQRRRRVLRVGYDLLPHLQSCLREYFVNIFLKITFLRT